MVVKNFDFKDQSKKPKYGNKFMVIGGSGYLGWPMVCQLAFKFPRCNVYVIDKDFQYWNGAEKLNELFGCEIELVETEFSNSFIEYFKPDVVINLADQNIEIKCHNECHLITLSEYEKEHNFPVTVFNTAKVIGNYNIITRLDDALRIRNKTFIDNIIDGVLIRDLEEDDVFSAISLEDFTRAVIKICRRIEPPMYDSYDLVDRNTSIFKLATLISKELGVYGFEIDNRLKVDRIKTNKKRLLKLIDKHRPPFEIMIKECVMESPLTDYKKFIIERYPSNISKYFLRNFNKVELIDKETKVVSIGSCFAENISKYLRRKKYNYLVTEKNSGWFSANWGIVFNSSSIRQIFEYSFDLFNPKIKWWEREEGHMQDPYRRNVVYPKGKHLDQKVIHINASRKAISKADVIIITLGLVEVWRDKRDGTVFWRVPPMHLYDPEIYEFYVMTVDDVYNDLVKVKSILEKYNPKCSLIVTVSPVPFQATYREDCDVVTANVYSKAVSTVSCNRFVSEFKDKNVYYFPSFEFVRYGFDNPYIEDGRHIREDVINTMMKFFERSFGK